MNAGHAPLTADSLYSAILLALIALAIALQASFLHGLAGGTATRAAPSLVEVARAPCVNG